MNQEEITSFIDINDDLALVSNFCPLQHQVAGHFSEITKTKLCFLQTNDGCVLKPIQSKLNGFREHDFLKRVFCTDDDVLHENEICLKQFLPWYRGSIIYDSVTYIKMDDIGYGLMKPSVIDLKIGRVTYDPFASAEKIHRCRLKYPGSANVGFTLSGMRVYDPLSNLFAFYDKVFGRSLNQDDIIHCFALFYQFQFKAQLHALKETLNKLNDINNWFERQKIYHFYSSSILIMYESDMEYYYENEGIDNNLGNLVRVSMIDFTHVVDAKNQIDENYLFGLKKLINYLRNLLNNDYKFKYLDNC